jgi:hypothetical protein
MIVKYSILILLGAAVAVLFTKSTFANPVVTSPSTELLRAIELGNAFLPSLKRKPRDLKLIEVKNVFGKPNIWRLTYKERSAMPRETGGLATLGGELFVEVDLDNGKTKFAGTGE